MATAKVELLNSLTHEHHGRRFKKNQPQILTNLSEIRYYQSQGGFSVNFMDKEELDPEKRKEKVSEEKPETKIETDNLYTKEELKDKSKKQLIDIGADFGLFLEAGQKKSSMVNEILKAQKKQKKEGE